MKSYEILIVDDEPENLEIIVNYVENSGEPYQILQALDAKTALQIAREERPDLIITDWDMPEMDGIELIKSLKSQKETADIPVIMCTGVMTSSDNLRTALEAGAVDYIRKPVDNIELISRMRSMLMLAESYEEIKGLIEKKDQIFSIIAHDLKAPVGNLSSIVELILDDQLTYNEIIKFLQYIRPNIGATYTLLDNLLSWARSQKNLTNYLPEEINLAQLCNENAKVLEHLAAAKNIRINNLIDKNTTAYADKNMVSSVIRNLLSNAIKFSYSHSDIIIKGQEQDDIVVVSVSDSGVGLDEAAISRIFDPDVLSTTPGTEAETGSGLGLSLIQDFIKQNGGKIWVDSEKGQGTTFYFSLPAVKQ